MSLLTITLFIRFALTLYQKAALQAESITPWVSFYWASSLVTGLCNIAIIVCEFTEIAIAVKTPFQFPFIKLIYTLPALGVFIFSDLFLAFYINKSATLQPPRIIRCVFYICCPCRCCSENCHLGLIQTMAIWNILAFVHFTAWTIVPLILYTFVLPLQALSVLALCVTTIFCVITLTALLIRKSSVRMIISQVILILIFLALVILIAALYLRFVNNGVQVDSVGGFITSFFPSAILTIIGWFVTKGKLFNQSQTQTSRHGREPEMAEEGVRNSNADSQNTETSAQTVSETTPLLN